jgi:hypothetical protein
VFETCAKRVSRVPRSLLKINNIPLLLLLLAAATGAQRGVAAPGTSVDVAATSGSAPYELRGDSVYIPGWDDQKVSDVVTLKTIGRDDFESSNSILWDRFVVLGDRNARSKVLSIPAGTNQLEVVANGGAVEHIWPRIEIVWQPEAGTTGSIVLFDRFINSRTLKPFKAVIPETGMNQPGRILVNITNASKSIALRYAHLLSISFQRSTRP